VMLFLPCSLTYSIGALAIMHGSTDHVGRAHTNTLAEVPADLQH
jgi:hypothetical protein